MKFNSERDALPFFSRRLIAIAAFALCSGQALAVDPFTVKDIRVEGIQRTEAGTVFSYLPVRVGDTFNDEKAAAAQANFRQTTGEDVAVSTLRARGKTKAADKLAAQHAEQRRTAELQLGGLTPEAAASSCTLSSPPSTSARSALASAAQAAVESAARRRGVGGAAGG